MPFSHDMARLNDAMDAFEGSILSSSPEVCLPSSSTNGRFLATAVTSSAASYPYSHDWICGHVQRLGKGPTISSLPSCDKKIRSLASWASPSGR